VTDLNRRPERICLRVQRWPEGDAAPDRKPEVESAGGVRVASRPPGRRARRVCRNRPHPARAARGPASVASEPRLSHTEAKYVDAAWSATVARDHACDGTHGPTFTTGSPSRALAARFAILRRPVTPADRLPTLLQHNLPPQQVAGGEAVYNRELHLNQIRLGRSAFGASFYFIPAGNVTAPRGVPARCGPEQVAALERRLSHLPGRERARILAAQARYLAYLRYLALHAEGICASYFPAHARKVDLANNLPNCATLADFGRWGVLVDASVCLDHVAVFWTVVQDGVATVTLRFVPHGGPLTNIATTTVRAVNNVVVTREPYHAPYQSGFPSTIVLRAADGTVIKKIAVTPNMPTLCGYGC
jgi:hypothetical protein